eukprot:1141501-Pelagomonas_calceolata.AAC.3
MVTPGELAANAALIYGFGWGSRGPGPAPFSHTRSVQGLEVILRKGCGSVDGQGSFVWENGTGSSTCRDAPGSSTCRDARRGRFGGAHRGCASSCTKCVPLCATKQLGSSRCTRLVAAAADAGLQHPSLHPKCLEWMNPRLMAPVGSALWAAA